MKLDFSAYFLARFGDCRFNLKHPRLFFSELGRPVGSNRDKALLGPVPAPPAPLSLVPF